MGACRSSESRTAQAHAARMALDAGWDEELLRIEIESLQGADFDVSLTGFGEDEIADLFSGDGEKDVKDDDFDLSAALEKAAFVEKGDIYRNV